MRKCPVCFAESESRKSIAYKSGYSKEILFCEHCGVGFAHPRIPDEILEDHYSHEASPWGDVTSLGGPRQFPVHYALGRARWKRIKNHLKDSSLRVLDIGAGNGALGLAIAHEGQNLVTEYIAQDIDLRILNQIPKFWPQSSIVKLKTVTSANEIEGLVDILVLSHVVEHIQEPVEFLTKILTKIKPGGVVFVEVPHKDYLFKKNVFPHVLFFDQKSLETAMKAANVSVKECGIWGGSSLHPPFTSSKLSTKIENQIFRFAEKIPESVLYGFFDWYYGASVTSSSGPWLRYVGVKNI